MSTLEQFGTPAFIEDFGPGTPEQAALAALWSTHVEAFTQQAILGNPWNVQFASEQTSYYDPLVTDVPNGTPAVLVQWNAFPNRLTQYLGAGAVPSNPYNMSGDELLTIADTGEGLQEIPTVLCPQAEWESPLHAYGPYGPRGWLDEYCEWSVCRDVQGGLLRIDFVCENPEYWYTLWAISPQRVAELYEQTLNAGAPANRQVSVTVDDLSLIDPSTGEIFRDPITGGPAYNPLNKWNSGPLSIRNGDAGDSGGAMHLTSTPNTVQTEMGLAGAATVQRTGGNADPQALICCAQYGQNYRNSDPHIGQSVNQVISAGNIASLADPIGLYIQPPRFDGWQLPYDEHLPDSAQPSDLWTVLRGAEQLTDPVTGEPFPGGFILHAALQIPQAWTDAGVSFGLGDVTVMGEPLVHAGQVAKTFNIGLFPRGIAAPAPAAESCVQPLTPGTPQPLQLFEAGAWAAYYGTQVPVPSGETMSLASNTVIMPPSVPQGTSITMALACNGVSTGAAPTIEVVGDGVTVSQVSEPEAVSYAVPGNSYPGSAQIVTFQLDVDASASTGLRGISLANAGASAGLPMPGLLNITGA